MGASEVFKNQSFKSLLFDVLGGSRPLLFGLISGPCPVWDWFSTTKSVDCCGPVPLLSVVF